MALDAIRTLVQADLEAADKFIIKELKSEVPLINQVTEYMLSCGGKRIRPLLVLLCARAFDYRDQYHINLAAIIELIHTATLLHDDVIDHATLRRGHETANARWGNQASILAGDFLYSRAFQLIANLNHPKIVNIIAHAANYISEGEILQLINSHNPDTTEQAYFNVIERKTAKLFEAAAQLGTALSSHTDTQMSAMKEYGMHLGMAYQLIDDALDYGTSSEKTGKTIGNDLTEGKPTLPLIHALRKSSASEAAVLRDAIKKGQHESLQDIISIIQSTHAIHYTADTAKHYAKKANQALTFIPKSPYRNALQDLSDFVVQRTY